MNPKARFLNYITIDTQSNPYTKTTPSTMGQKELGKYLVNELHDLGIRISNLIWMNSDMYMRFYQVIVHPHKQLD